MLLFKTTKTIYMKNVFYYLLIATLIFPSCKKDFLDKTPLDSYADGQVWNDINLVNSYVTQNYRAITSHNFGWPAAGSLDVWKGAQWGGLCAYGYGWGGVVDEAFELHDWYGFPQPLLDGSISPSNATSFGRWNENYGYIRAINIFFSKIDEVRGDAKLKERLKGEMYFLRAFCYNELTKHYGGVILIDKVYGVADKDFQETRSSYDACVNFIVSDLEKAASLLPLTYQDVDQGRVTNGAALALKSNLLLFAASPLHNPGNDKSKWQKAADAAKAVIDLGKYSLYKPANYANVFLDHGNSEVILAKYYNGTAEDWWHTNYENTINRDLSPVSYFGWGMATPIQEMVDAYEMIDGTKFNWSNPVHSANPYNNRDPRFYATIFFDGAMHKGRAVETYEGGHDNPTGATVEITNATTTGYYLRKFVDDNYDQSTKPWTQDNMVIFIRLSEIYLNYAEANAELGNTTVALEYLNRIRQRVNMPSVSASGTLLIDKIMQERRIELAFEGQRFFDVRRRKILDQVMKPVSGIKIIKSPNGDRSFSVFQRQARVYSEKSYYFPIPATEIQKNSKLTQNPGY